MLVTARSQTFYGLGIDNKQGISPGLQRARAPFRTRNAITGLVISAFVFSVWAYSISAVKQDTFDDLDEEARGLLASRKQAELAQQQQQGQRTTPGVISFRDTSPPKMKKLKTADVAALTGQTELAAAMAAGENKSGRGEPKGALARELAKRYPGVLDPTAGTLVWGAPSVDRIGKMGDRGRPT